MVERDDRKPIIHIGFNYGFHIAPSQTTYSYAWAWNNYALEFKPINKLFKLFSRILNKFDFSSIHQMINSWKTKNQTFEFLFFDYFERGFQIFSLIIKRPNNERYIGHKIL